MYKCNLPEIDFIKKEEVLNYLSSFENKNLKVEYKNTFKKDEGEEVKKFSSKEFYEKIKSFDIFDICQTAKNEIQIFSVDSWMYLNIA